MLEVRFGKKKQLCDGVTRRDVLKIGALGFGALTLADLFRLEAKAAAPQRHKAVINIHLTGGPSHIDTFDMRPNLPSEYRGEFSPIKTNVPGIEICELLPKLAAMADKYAIVRSLVGMAHIHSGFQVMTGYPSPVGRVDDYRPSFGSLVAKLTEDENTVPISHVAYNSSAGVYAGGQPGYLGARYQGCNPDEAIDLLRRNAVLTDQRLDDRANLLQSLDKIRRNVDGDGQMDALDSYTQQAVDIVTSGSTADALDLSKEDPAVVERYGDRNRNLLSARRLIQAGVRAVTMSGPWEDWDTHTANFRRIKDRNLPYMDHGLSTFLWDLDRLGILDDVAIVVWGEFGRTLRINEKAGRDHWPRTSFCAVRGWGNAHRPGHRGHRPHSFVRRGQPHPLPAGVCHAVPLLGHRPGHSSGRQLRAATILTRKPPTDLRADLMISQSLGLSNNVESIKNVIRRVTSFGVWPFSCLLSPVLPPTTCQPTTSRLAKKREKGIRN